MKKKHKQNRELSTVLCDDLEGWNGREGWRLKREEIYIYLWLIHSVVPKKPGLPWWLRW